MAGTWGPREHGESQQIPQPWEKFQLWFTINHWTQINRKVGMVSPTVQKTTCLARQSLEDIVMWMIYSIFSSKKSFPALKKEGARWWVTNTLASTRATFIKADFVFSNLRKKKASDGVWQEILLVSQLVIFKRVACICFQNTAMHNFWKEHRGRADICVWGQGAYFLKVCIWE